LAFANPTVNIDQKIRILSPYFSAFSIPSIKERAFDLTRLCITAHPMEAKAYAIYGDFLYQDKQLDSAMSAYQNTIRLDKKVFAVWQNLMFIEIELLDYTALLNTSGDAIQLFPAQQIVHYLNAVAKAQKKDFEGALVSYQNALTLSVNNPETEAQIHAGMGDAYHSLKKHTESDESYDKALSIRPDDPYVLNNFAYYLSLRNINLEKALSMSQKSNDLMKSNASFLDTYAWILFRLARYDDALIWIEKAITAGGSKSVTVIEHRGDVLIKLNRTEEAIEEWNKAAKMAEPSELLKRKINTKQYHEQ
jgi:tetratricopeptide (TPR) repeat protein